MLRKLVLTVVLSTSAFAQNAAISSAGFQATRELRAYSALAHAFTQTPAAETSGFDSNYKLSLPQPVQDKNFIY